MNNIDIPISRVFLTALEGDKSKIKSISPSVVFQRLFNLGERFDYREVITALQNSAARHGKLREFQTNFQNSNLVGEIMTFDIGPEGQQAWCQFKVVKEPLPGEANESAINFVVIVTDRKEGKQYTRLVGACQREADKKTGHKVPVFRTISDMIEEVEVAKEIDESKLRPLDLEKIIVKKGTIVRFEMTDEEDEVRILGKDDKEITRFADPDVDTIDFGVWYECGMDVPQGLLKHCPVSEIMESFVKKEPVKVLNEESAPSQESVQEEPEAPAEEQTTPEETAEESTPAAEEGNNEPEPPAPAAEEPAPEEPAVVDPILFKKDEIVLIEDLPGKTFKALHDITESEYKATPYPACVNTLLVEVVEEKPVIEEPKKEEPDMNTPAAEDVVVYEKDDIVELPQCPGKKFRANDTITRSMLDANNGVIDDFITEIKEEPAPTEAKPVGEIPNQSLVKDEHSATEYLKMYFKTSTPNIMHVMNKIRDEAQQTDILRLTSTYPIETMSIYTDYTFSIVRMKNGCFYRVFVAHTDADRMEKASWLETANEDGRWFKIADITDREVDIVMRRRFR